MRAESNMITAENILPYVVRSEYREFQSEGSTALTWPLGFNLDIVLVFDLGDRVQNATIADLDALKMSVSEAKARAIQNLQTLVRSGKVQMRLFNGPENKPFVLVGGTWAAATCILLPDLRAKMAKNLGAEELCVSIPHREAMLIFPMGDAGYREIMRKVISEREGNAPKPLTTELFKLIGERVAEFHELP